MRRIGFLFFPAIAVGVALYGAQPTTQPSKAEIRGTITLSTELRLTRMVAVDRAWADVIKTSEPDAGVGKDTFVYLGTLGEGGSFSVAGLLPGRSYDLIFWTRDRAGREVRWEGACMDYHRAIIPSTEVTPEDRKNIEELITGPAQFYDKVRVLRMAADHQHATALVELMRTRDFHSDAGGEVIYRVELWYYENLFGGWAKDKNTEGVLARVRGRPNAMAKDWQFLPELGGIAAGKADVKVTLPDKVDGKRGIVGEIQVK